MPNSKMFKPKWKIIEDSEPDFIKLSDIPYELSNNNISSFGWKLNKLKSKNIKVEGYNIIKQIDVIAGESIPIKGKSRRVQKIIAAPIVYPVVIVGSTILVVLALLTGA